MLISVCVFAGKGESSVFSLRRGLHKLAFALKKGGKGNKEGAKGKDRNT